MFPDRNTPNAVQNSRLEIWFLYHFHTQSSGHQLTCKKLYKVSHRVRNSEMKTLHRNLDCPEIWMSHHTYDVNFGKNHKYWHKPFVQNNNNSIMLRGGGGNDRNINQLAKPAFRSQCAHTRPMDTVLSSRLFLEW